jgi:hypothetical protein
VANSIRAASLYQNQTNFLVLTILNLLELVLAISLISFGSSHTFFLPHLITEAASLFCSLREL